MKKIIISICICISLISLPCLSYAGHSKAGSLITTPLLGLSVGMIIGAAVAAISTSSSAAPIAVGGGIGLVLGLALALATPADEGRAQSFTGENSENPSGSVPSDSGPDGAVPNET